MIWFACKQCGKRHGRAEHLAGTLVFCECGHGNRVPWSSTVAEPEPEEAQPVPPPSQPRVPRPAFDEDRPPHYPPSSREDRGGRWPRHSAERRRPNPAYCLNHDETPKDATCTACHGSFCSACVVALQGQTLCGPCKNFRLGGMSRPSRLTPLALVAFILALVSTLVTLFLSFLAIGTTLMTEAGLAVAIPCLVVALLFAGGELILGGLALRQIDRQPALGGRGLAMTGAMAGLTGMVWASAIGLFIILHQMQG
jgi:hypothetical protein